MLDAGVAVPGFKQFQEQQNEPGGVAVAYEKALLDLGLTVEVVRADVQSSLPSGWIGNVSPPPGTVVEEGSTVTVSASR